MSIRRGPLPPSFIYSMAYDGVDEGIKLDNTNNATDMNFGFDDSFSISLWAISSNEAFNMLMTKSAYYPFATAPTPAGPQGWQFGFTSNKLQFSLNSIVWNSGISNSNLEFQTFKLRNSWHHYAVTYNGSRLGSGIKIYIDSIDVSGAGTNLNMDASKVCSTTSSIFIGDRDTTSPGNTQTNASWLGNIDEVAVWEDTVLSPSQIYQIYNGTPPVGAVSPGWIWTGGTGTPNNIGNLSPTYWNRKGELATYSNPGGIGDWMFPDKGSSNYTSTSENMEEADRSTSIPPT